MNSLLYSGISAELKKHRPYKELFEAIKAKRFPLHLHGVHGGLSSVLFSKLRERGGSPVLVVMPTEREAQRLARDVAGFGFNPAILPWWETVPYRGVPRNSPVFGQRLRVLDGMLDGSLDLIFTGIRAFLSPLPPPEYLKSGYLAVKKGMTFDPQEFARRLVDNGYFRVQRVSVPGEFALRGEVCDVFMPGDDNPVRIVFGWDEIEEIRRFDVGSQSSLEILGSISLRPSRELVWDDERIAALRKNAGQLSELKDRVDEIVEGWIETLAEGHERYFPLAFAPEERASILDYLGDEVITVFTDYERCYSAEESLQREYGAMYRKLRHQEPLPRPERILMPLEELENSSSALIRMPLLRSTRPEDHGAAEAAESPAESLLEEVTPIDRSTRPELLPAASEIRFDSDGSRSFFGNISFFKEELQNMLAAGYRVIVLADSDVQKMRLEHLLQEYEVEVLAEGISEGFSIRDRGLMIIHENEIFGRKKRVPRSVKKVKSEAIDSFVELDEGDHVVHVNHGIGRFRGIQRITAGGNERDYIKLEYAGEEFIFVPIEQVNLIQRYIGSQGSDPRLDTIGGKNWEKRKARVTQHVEDLAERLLKLYSRRKKATGYAFPEDSEWQIEFEAAFPFEETEDQARCIDEVKRDMERAVPMDRLVCGDVGYGKTEIAMRAAFKAIASGKQVAFLAPTTILAEQHYESLEERLEKFPVKLAMMSRLVSRADQKKSLAGLESGEIDMVVGTHRIIQKDVKFANLGLLVIDEEQRFGVKDKERLKELKASIDCLTLSATPIPRTLHMSLLKIRDMSLLKTPPYNRRPIETYVEAFDEELVARAIRKEVERGGQVFYLHNRVETLENVQLFLRKVVPEVMVEMAHGQMNAHELEDIMHRFIHGGFHVLVATTIIENGINIPNVNTIIIDRADMYGISQLYQLRGRVGRSGRLAHAYLLYPEQRALSELAMKRLQIISDHTELGSGFKIAMKDLEVRGAGNLLGSQQSGDIYSIGFDLYLRLLDQAIRRLSDEQEELPSEIYLEMEYSGFIPDAYISDTMEKMEVYKKIASVTNRESLDAVHGEIVDRYGPIPDEVASLLSLAEIRILCWDLNISMIRERKGVARVHFAKVARLNINKIMELIRTSGGSVKVDPKHPEVLMVDTSVVGLKEKSEYLRDRLSTIAG
jgi:transcription-repair coupling factor (superfamily II helicase)